jgi:3-deoxy-manno-octulosonate cytidylyltransferase (CMP-KDO synthetase)
VRTIGIIPARYAASRFPGKVTAMIAGTSMLERVWRGATASTRLREVLIATDDERISTLARSFGAHAVMTSPLHPTGTDRIAEVAAGLEADVVVNIQGDEPLIEPFVIDAAVDALAAAPGAPMATVAQALEARDIDDANRVKVVMDRSGNALYFSRAAIPASFEGVAPKSRWHHIGLYAYRRDFLLDFVRLERSDAEVAEGLEQLRALEHGHAIRVATIEGWRGQSVDVPADIARVEAQLRARRAAGEEHC